METLIYGYHHADVGYLGDNFVLAHFRIVLVFMSNINLVCNNILHIYIYI